MLEQPSTTRFLMLGALETLINQALELEGRTSQRLHTLHGTVVRLRCSAPAFSLYLLLCEDGIEILENYEGHIDIRVRASLGALLHWILTAGATPDDDAIAVSGPQDKVDLVVEALQEFDIWSAMRRWLDEHVRADELVALIRRQDPRWLETLQGVSSEVESLSTEIGRQRLLQEEILEELRSLRRYVSRERRLDMGFLFFGVALLLAAFASADGQLPILVQDIQESTQTLLLASLGITLMLSRILFGNRHS